MNKLIIVEGIPTAGKSQTLSWIKQYLLEVKKSFEFVDDGEVIEIFKKRNDKSNTDSVEGVQEYLIK